MPKRILKTVLLIDLVDSEVLVDALGEYRAAQIFERYNYAARELLARHKGVEIDKADGLLAVFDLPIDAVLYALALHVSLAVLSEAPDVELAARVGIHQGEVVASRPPPNHAAPAATSFQIEEPVSSIVARIMSLARGGQTLVTGLAFELAWTAADRHAATLDDVIWVEHGSYQFTGIANALAVCEVGRRSEAPPTAPQDSDSAWRVGAPCAEPVAEWRPAVGLAVPGRDGWRLERKLGESNSGELWCARQWEDKTLGGTLGCEDAIPGPSRAGVIVHLGARQAAGARKAAILAATRSDLMCDRYLGRSARHVRSIDESAIDVWA